MKDLTTYCSSQNLNFFLSNNTVTSCTHLRVRNNSDPFPVIFVELGMKVRDIKPSEFKLARRQAPNLQRPEDVLAFRTKWK